MIGRGVGGGRELATEGPGVWFGEEAAAKNCTDGHYCAATSGAVMRMYSVMVQSS